MSIVGLAHAEREEGAFAVDPAGADAHGGPAHLVQHHPDPVHLVGVHQYGSVETYFYH